MRTLRGLCKGRVLWMVVILPLIPWTLNLSGQETSSESKPWFNPKNLVEAVARIRELEWSWTVFEDGEPETMNVGYRLLRYETVQGRRTALVELTIDEDLWQVWLDSDGQVVQAAIDGELLPQMLAEMIVSSTLVFIFTPFFFAEPYRVPEVLVETPPGTEIRVREGIPRKVGDLVIPVQVVEMRVFGEPYLKPGEQATFVWVIGDLGDFLMLVQWEVVDVQAEDLMAMNMVVKHVVPR